MAWQVSHVVIQCVMMSFLMKYGTMLALCSTLGKILSNPVWVCWVWDLDVNSMFFDGAIGFLEGTHRVLQWGCWFPGGDMTSFMMGKFEDQWCRDTSWLPMLVTSFFIVFRPGMSLVFRHFFVGFFVCDNSDIAFWSNKYGLIFELPFFYGLKIGLSVWGLVLRFFWLNCLIMSI
jgi:hypothetical protein